MTLKLIVLIRANTSRDVVEYGRGNNRFRVRQGSVVLVRLQSFRCVGAVDCLGARGQGNGVGEGDENQREGNETPAVIADVVEFEVVRGEVGLGRRTEPFKMSAWAVCN